MNDKTKAIAYSAAHEDGRVISNFDRIEGALRDLPDVVMSRPSTVRAELPLIGIAQSYITQTYRQWGVGDTIFLETVSAEGSIRMVIPPEVAEVIRRQAESLGTQSRRKLGKRQAAARKESGVNWPPAFLKNKGRGIRKAEEVQEGK